jgi:hypothetical protein
VSRPGGGHNRPTKVDLGTMTTDQLAARWNVSYETLSRWRRIGRGPNWFRLDGAPNGAVRYHLIEVEAHEAIWGQFPSNPATPQ